MKKVTDTRHLVCRAGTWYYRRRVPEHARAAVGKAVLQFTLNTTRKAEAKRLREAWDLRWSAEFDRASSTAADQPGLAPHSRTLTEAEAVRLVRDYVARLDRRFQDRQLTDGPESEAQRAEMVADIEYGTQMLRDPDDPRGPERVYAAEKRLLSEAGAQPGPDGITEAAFSDMVRRGILEVDFRKLARLADDYSQRGRDPLFDPAAPPPMTFAELADQFLTAWIEEAEVNGTDEKYIDRQRANVSLVRQLFGDGILVRDLDYDACEEARRLLARVPANRTKIYRDLPLREVIRRADEEGRERLAPITQGQYLATLRDVLDLAQRKRLIPDNPTTGMRPLKRDDIALADKRHPFTPDQLAAFFRSQFYQGCAESGPTPYNHDTKGGWRFWLPLVSLFTGLRPREICQMLVGDVRKTSGGTYYLDVIAAEQDGETSTKHSLKTRSSRRRVPLHPILIRIGFLSFVDEVSRLQGHGYIFPLKPDKYGNPAWYPLRACLTCLTVCALASGGGADVDRRGSGDVPGPGRPL